MTDKEQSQHSVSTDTLRKLNEVQQQKKNQRLVDNEVMTCVSSMVEYILKKGFEDTEAPFSMDEIENQFSLNEEEAIDAIIDFLEEDTENISTYCNATGNTKTDLPSIKMELGAMSKDELKELMEELGLEPSDYEEPAEIYEWWICSSYLINKLIEQGEPVIPYERLWGRCTTGQSIILDSVITRIQQETKYGEGATNDNN